MIRTAYVVEGDGIIYKRKDLSDEGARDLIRFGSVVAVFQRNVAGIQYADVDKITHEIVWKFAVKQEE